MSSTAPFNEFIVLIPARLDSTRLPRKPLADIAGKPMVVRVAEQARKSLAKKVIVATDSTEIQAACALHHIDCVITRADHLTGTDRLAEATQLLSLKPTDVVVNVQGDEPLIPPELINQVALTLITHPQAAIATVAVVIQDASEIASPHVVKVVLNHAGEAMYFSRSVIPFLRQSSPDKSKDAALLPNYLRHLGIYAYRANFLLAYSQLAVAPPEIAESLEQLRALWHGYPIQVYVTNKAPPAGVDTAADLERVRALWK